MVWLPCHSSIVYTNVLLVVFSYFFFSIPISNLVAFNHESKVFSSFFLIITFFGAPSLQIITVHFAKEWIERKEHTNESSENWSGRMRMLRGRVVFIRICFDNISYRYSLFSALIYYTKLRGSEALIFFTIPFFLRSLC